MSLLNHKLSLVHFIKCSTLPYFGYVEEIEAETPVVTNASLNSYRLEHGDIVYADPSGYVSPSGIRIYDGERLLELSEYSINVITGEFILQASPSGALACSYSRNTVNVIDAFPEAEEFEAMSLPVVCIDFQEDSTRPYAIGGQEAYHDMMFFIDIFALSDSMRLQLGDRIAKGLRTWIPILDMEKCMPVNYDGTINTAFDWREQFQYWLKIRIEPRVKMLNTGSTSIKEKYRALIDGTMTTIK